MTAMEKTPAIFIACNPTISKVVAKSWIDEKGISLSPTKDSSESDFHTDQTLLALPDNNNFLTVATSLLTRNKVTETPYK